VMSHLTSAQLIDLAENSVTGVSEPSLSHVRSCAACHRQLEDLRATMAAVSEVPVPEPSPLYWEHFSARVREAVANERTGNQAGFERWSWLRAKTLWVAAASVAVLAVAVTLRVDREPVSAPSIGSATVSITDVAEPLEPADDPSLSLVGDLAADLDWDAASEAGFTTHVGVDNDAITQLSDGERHELHQLLKGEMGRSGPS
jgi:hypothetical protein